LEEKLKISNEKEKARTDLENLESIEMRILFIDLNKSLFLT
jgi:hypothetical protein